MTILIVAKKLFLVLLSNVFIYSVSSYSRFSNFLLPHQHKERGSVCRCDSRSVVVLFRSLLFFFQCALVLSFSFRRKHDGSFASLQTESRYEATSKWALQVRPHTLISHRHISQLMSWRNMKHLLPEGVSSAVPLIFLTLCHCAFLTLIFSSLSLSSLSISFQPLPASIFGCFEY